MDQLGERNNKKAYFLATVSVLRTHNIYVDCIYLASCFEQDFKKVKKHSLFECADPRSENLSSPVHSFCHTYNIPHKVTQTLLLYVSAVRSKTALSPLYKVSVAICLYLKSVLNITVQRLSAMCVSHFNIKRNTLLRHVKLCSINTKYL